MASELDIDPGTTVGATTTARRLRRRHVVLAAVVVSILLGAGLRFVPSDAAASGSTGGQDGPASTACAAQ